MKQFMGISFNEIRITSDPHFNHSNIIKYVGRPFDTMQGMNSFLKASHNKQVGEKDLTIFIGDFGFFNSKHDLASLMKSLNGTKVLVMGNHDDKLTALEYVDAGFMSVHTFLYEYGYKMIHDPSATCGVDSGDWLVGHLHSKSKEKRHSNWLDVGVDGNTFQYYTYEEIDKYFE